MCVSARRWRQVSDVCGGRRHCRVLIVILIRRLRAFSAARRRFASEPRSVSNTLRPAFQTGRGYLIFAGIAILVPLVAPPALTTTGPPRVWRTPALGVQPLIGLCS